MALIEILKDLFDGYGTSGIGPLVLIIIPVIASVIMSFRTLLDSLRLRKDLTDVLILIPPYILIITVAFVEFFISLMLFESKKCPAELVGQMAGLYGNSLCYEALSVVILSLFLMILYAYTLSRINIKYKGRSILSIMVRLNLIDLLFCAYIIVFTIMRMLFSLPDYGGRHNDDILFGLYLYTVYSLIIKSLFIVFSLLWALLFGKREKEDMPLSKNIYISVEKRIQKNNLYRMLVVVIFSLCISAALVLILQSNLENDASIMESKYAFIVYILGAMILFNFFAWLLKALFPSKTKDMREILAKYPNLEELSTEIEIDREANLFYQEKYISISRNFYVYERGLDITICDFQNAVSYEKAAHNSLVMTVLLKNGRRLFLNVGSPEGFEAMKGALAIHLPDGRVFSAPQSTEG